MRLLRRLWLHLLRQARHDAFAAGYRAASGLGVESQLVRRAADNYVKE